jgi:hypothetical protein
MLMKTLQSANTYLTVVINKSKDKKKVALDAKGAMKPTILFADKKGTILSNTVDISPEETMVIQWK